MAALGQQVLAKFIEDHKLAAEDLALLESLSHKHDLTYEVQIWHAHAYWPKERLYSIITCMLIPSYRSYDHAIVRTSNEAMYMAKHHMPYPLKCMHVIEIT